MLRHDPFMVGLAQASSYRALLEAGVRIHRYPAPYILCTKPFTVDVERTRAVEDDYRELSRMLPLEEGEGRRPRLRYVDHVMRLTSALP